MIFHDTEHSNLIKPVITGIKPGFHIITRTIVLSFPKNFLGDPSDYLLSTWLSPSLERILVTKRAPPPNKCRPRIIAALRSMNMNIDTLTMLFCTLSSLLMPICNHPPMKIVRFGDAWRVVAVRSKLAYVARRITVFLFARPRYVSKLGRFNYDFRDIGGTWYALCDLFICFIWLFSFNRNYSYKPLFLFSI